jgi:hypothetical protein
MRTGAAGGTGAGGTGGAGGIGFVVMTQNYGSARNRDTEPARHLDSGFPYLPDGRGMVHWLHEHIWGIA